MRVLGKEQLHRHNHHFNKSTYVGTCLGVPLQIKAKHSVEYPEQANSMLVSGDVTKIGIGVG